eukprot:TRINITY_DN8078_c0_g2_i1.p1 TRINITY_DN8078_c0_g2~~TRINITY_DN8078_c0_g2_i1.p1  ORF type:complete len:301 (+),score=35.47 TRINITY_DN8078_c0_g2_i1:70-903(+)
MISTLTPEDGEGPLTEFSDLDQDVVNAVTVLEGGQKREQPLPIPDVVGEMQYYPLISVRCGACDKFSVQTYYCPDCKDAFCEFCWKRLAKHRKATAVPHVPEEMAFPTFCPTCNRLFCSDRNCSTCCSHPRRQARINEVFKRECSCDEKRITTVFCFDCGLICDECDSITLHKKNQSHVRRAATLSDYAAQGCSECGTSLFRLDQKPAVLMPCLDCDYVATWPWYWPDPKEQLERPALEAICDRCKKFITVEVERKETLPRPTLITVKPVSKMLSNR